MSKVKGILKGSLGILKIAGGIAPFVLLGGVAGIGTAIGFNKNYEKLVNDYSQTDTFIQRSIEDMNSLEQQFTNGEITSEEYGESFRHLGSGKYVKDLINEDIDGNEEYQARLKSCNALQIASLALGGCAILGIVLSGIFVNTGITEKAIDSGKDDITEAEIEFNLKSDKKPKSSRRKGRLEADENKQPNIIITTKDDEDKPLDDMIDKSGVDIGNLDDFMDQFSDKK